MVIAPLGTNQSPGKIVSCGVSGDMAGVKV